MKPVFSLLTASCLALAFVSSALAAEAPPRIAVVGEGEAAALGDLLATHLSESTGCQLVERAELNRIAGEAALAGLSKTERPLNMARLASANALLFASVDAADSQHPLLVLRLTTTADGTVRHAFVLPWLRDEIPTNARLAAAQLKAPVQRLKEIGKLKPLTVSLLGLRSAVDDTKLKSLETTLNTLLGHRLAAQPGLVLVERWRMEDLVFERSLVPLGAPGLATGSTLLDGSFTAQGTALAVRLRWQISETGEATVHTLRGSTSDVPALVESIVKLFAGEMHGPALSAPWEPQAEARAFAELGDWLAKHSLGPEAAQAFESAVALGNKDSKTLVGRTQAYAFCAYPEYLQGAFSPTDGAYRSFSLQGADLTHHLAAASRAIDCAMDILENAPAQASTVSIEQPAILGIGVFYTAVRVLRAVQEARVQVKLAAQVRPLRAAVQRLMTLLDASDRARSYPYLVYKANYAACWCATPEDTLAYYRLILSPKYGSDIKWRWVESWATGLREELTSPARHGPFLDREAASVEERFATGIARLMEWESTDNSAMKTRWTAFIKELRASSDVQEQADGLCFELASYQEPANRSRLLTEKVEWLWARRQAATEPGTEAIYAALHTDMDLLARGGEHAAAHRRLVAFLTFALNEGDWLTLPPIRWIELSTRVSKDANLSSDEARQLLEAFDRYTARRKGDPRWTDEYSRSAMGARDALQRTVPDSTAITGPRSNVDVLQVTRIWMPARYLYPYVRNSGTIASKDPPDIPLQTFEDRVWLGHTRAGIISLNLATFEATVTPGAEKFFAGWRILPTASDLWAANEKVVARRSRAGGDWETLALPEARYSVLSVAGKIYALSPQLKNSSSNGLSLLEFTTAGPHLIFSTRRRPPEHPFDAKEIFSIQGAFTGPKGEPWIAVSEHPPGSGLAIYSLAQPGKPVWQFPERGPQIKADGPRTLLVETFFEKERGVSVSGIWLIDPAKDSPVLLLHNPVNSSQPNAGIPRWPLPAVLNQPAPGVFPFHSPIMRGEEMWMLKWKHVSLPQGGATDLELLGFLPRRAMAVRIPLKLVAAPEDVEALHNIYTAAPAERLTMPFMWHDALVATSHGLAFTGRNCEGVWIIPWTDIDQWVKAHP